MKHTVVGRPTDPVVQNIQHQLRLWKRNLTRQEWMQAMQFERRVVHLPHAGPERRSA